MIKKRLLNFYSNRNLAKRNAGTGISFVNARKIGIVANLNERKIEEYFGLTEALITERKEVSLIGVCNNPKKLVNQKIENVVSFRSFNFLGRSNSAAFLAFKDIKHDLIFVIDHQGDSLIKYITSLCNSPRIVGVSKKNVSFCDLIIKARKEEEFTELIKYLKKIDS